MLLSTPLFSTTPSVTIGVGPAENGKWSRYVTQVHTRTANDSTTIIPGGIKFPVRIHRKPIIAASRTSKMIWINGIGCSIELKYAPTPNKMPNETPAINEGSEPSENGMQR